MEARAATPRIDARLTAGAALALMFNEVPIAVERLALCLRTQRRIGAAHALLHLRRLVAVCLRQNVSDDSPAGTEARRLTMSLAQPLKELDDALAADRLESRAIAAATLRLSLVRFHLWRIEMLTPALGSGHSAPGSAKAMT